MNNWRLLLLAVVTLLQPIGSFTESNHIDGRQECCDHRTNSASQDTRLYGDSRKSIPLDRSLSFREDSRRYQARNDPIRTKERLIVKRAQRRIAPEIQESKFARDQERRQRLVNTIESRQTRKQQILQIRRGNSRDSLNQRDALDSNRIGMSRDNSKIGRHSIRIVRDYTDNNRLSTNRDSATLSRERNDVARDENRRLFGADTFGSGTRAQDNYREFRSLDRRMGEILNENRRARSSATRVNNVERENRRTEFRTVSERVGEVRQDQTMESRDKTITQRDSSKRVAVDHRRESRNVIERVDQTRRNIREYDTNAKIDNRRKIQDERSSERHDTSLDAVRRQSLSRESRIMDGDVRSEKIVNNNERTDARRVVTRDMTQSSRDSSNERRQNFQASKNTRILRISATDNIRDERRQPAGYPGKMSARSSVSRSNERQTIVRVLDENVRHDERAAPNRRDVRNIDERLAERKHHRESRISRDRQIVNLQNSKLSNERRQETRRNASPSRVNVNGHSERESRIEETQDHVRAGVNSREREERNRDQNLIRMTLVTERRNINRQSRTQVSERASSNERGSRMPGYIKRERSDIRLRESRGETRASTDGTLGLRVVTTLRSLDTRGNSGNIRGNSELERATTLQDIKDPTQEVQERDISRSSWNRIFTSRLSRESHRYQARESTRDSRVDARNEVNRYRSVQKERFESRRDEGRPQDMRRQTHDMLTTRSEARRSRDTTSRDVERRSEELSRRRDNRRTNERDARNNGRDFKAAESRLEYRMIEREIQLNRHILAMERMDRVINRESRDAKLRSSDDVFEKVFRSGNMREVRENRFLRFEAKVRDIEPVAEEHDNQNAMSWQMVFYTLQGAYLFGLLMQMLTEKSKKGKSGNFTWWTSASKDLIKVD